MSDNTDTKAHIVLMKPRCAAKSTCHYIEALVEVHECDCASYDDRTGYHPWVTEF